LLDSTVSPQTSHSNSNINNNNSNINNNKNRLTQYVIESGGATEEKCRQRDREFTIAITQQENHNDEET